MCVEIITTVHPQTLSNDLVAIRYETRRRERRAPLKEVGGDGTLLRFVISVVDKCDCWKSSTLHTSLDSETDRAQLSTLF